MNKTKVLDMVVFFLLMMAFSMAIISFVNVR